MVLFDFFRGEKFRKINTLLYVALTLIQQKECWKCAFQAHPNIQYRTFTPIRALLSPNLLIKQLSDIKDRLWSEYQ
jgi:hypothetical protein